MSVGCNKIKDGRIALNVDARKHTEKPTTSYTDEGCVIVEGLIKGD
jgi:hypothetical protein